MTSVYAHRVQQSAGHVFGPYPLSLTGCNPNHQRPRHPSEQNEDDDENESELASASSEDDEDDAENDEEMMLDNVIDSGNSDWQAELPADDHHHPQQQQLQQQQQQPLLPPPPPIVVTYGPFHSPDVDVAVAYGQMVCYLWFWSPTSSKSQKPFDSSASVLQLQPQPHFIHFLSKVITQTQLSKTVLVLALHYLWLLKRPVMAGAAGRHEANMGPVNAPSELATAQVGQGSQYTVSVIALMLANKFMDDNTYTNKSWAAICGVTLERINTMEREFLKAINHALHVDVNRFMSWIRIMQSFFVQRQSRFDSRPRPRQTVPLPQHHYHHHHAHHLLASSGEQQPYANTPRSVGYTRARSASPGPFQFTFVPPNAQTSLNDTHNTLPSSLAGRSMHVRRPVTQHTLHSYHPQQQQRPVTSTAQDSHGAGNSSSVSQQQPQWVDPASSASALDPLFITIPGTLQRTRSKRSASQAFSPNSAEPPRPRPDERVQHQHQHLIHPHPIHAHKKAKPLLVAYPSHHLVQHPVGGIRRIHQVHEALASRPSTAVEINFSRMSLGSHGPSPVSDEDVRNRSAARHQQPPPPPHGAVYPHLAAPFDPYTAPSFRNEGSREGEPLELQYYQLVQGGRGVLRAQPSVPLPPAPRQEYVYEGDMSPYERECMRRDRLNSFGASSSAPGSAGRETRTRYPVSATFSTDDEEGMSGSESSNGTGWEHQHPFHPHQRSQPSFLQPGGRHQSSHSGGGYSLPPLSSLLAETSHRFSSPAGSTTSRNRPSPLGQNVQYAEFANAGPPASYAPQWGFQPPISSVQQVQYPPLQTVFQSPITMEQGPHSDSGHGNIRTHHSSLPLPFSHTSHSQHSSHLHSHHSPLRHAQVQVSPAYAHNAFTPQFAYQGR